MSSILLEEASEWVLNIDIYYIFIMTGGERVLNKSKNKEGSSE